MSFLNPSSSDDHSPHADDSAPGSSPATSSTADPDSEDGSQTEAAPQFSHGGLATVDPWNRQSSWQQAIWPWGLGGVIETLDVVILALAMFLCVRFVAHNYIVDGSSMAPTFHSSDFVIVNRLAYRSFDVSWIPGVDEDEWQPFGDPEPGDVVVFAYQQEPTERDFIKRVIAVPGQTVQVTDGVVYVDGVPLDEPYIAEPPAYEYPPTEVPEGTLFVLGDNRNNSFDSHAFGPVDVDRIVGRAEFRYWPVTRWSLVGHDLGEPVAEGVNRVGGRLAAAWW